MPATGPQPTPFPEVNAVLDRLLADVQTVLGEAFVGLVLFGSLASGDFNPQRSDIDFVVITAAELSDRVLQTLVEMHARIRASGLKWALKLEGSYIPREALRRHDPAHCVHPALRMDGSFDLDEHGSDWAVQRHLIREQGIVLAGPDPRTLIDPVRPDDLRQAVRGTLREWWAPKLENPAWLHDAEYQAYAVLTMCRVLYTLQYGLVASKPVAARWAQGTLGEPWAALIARALAWRHGDPWDHLDRTLAFIRYTVDAAS